MRPWRHRNNRLVERIEMREQIFDEMRIYQVSTARPLGNETRFPILFADRPKGATSGRTVIPAIRASGQRCIRVATF